MTRIDKDNINRRTENRHLFRRFCLGVEAVKSNPSMRLILVGFLVFLALLWIFRGVIFGIDDLGPFAQPVDGMARLVIIALGIMGGASLFVLMGTPRGEKAAKEGLQKVGLVNHAGEAPVLIAKRQDKDNPWLTA